MAVVFKNNAKTTLASGLTSSATSATVADGSTLPSLSGGNTFFCTFDDGTNVEVVKVTARSSNTLTIVRAQDDTTARSFSTGAVAELRLTAGILNLFSQTGVAVTDEIEAYLDANGLTFPDNVKAQFGAGSDLQIYHSGTNSFITEAGTGSLFIDSDNTIHMRNVAGNSNMAQFTPGGAVSLYHANGLRLATTSTGIDVTGNILSGDITIADATTPVLTLSDTGNAGGGGATGKVIFKNTGGDAMGIGYTSNVVTDSDMIISTNAGGTYGGYLGLDASAISDPKADIILEPKTNVFVATGDVGIGQQLPTTNINSGSFFKPDINGKFLTLNGGANGSFIMLESSTTTAGDQVGGLFFTDTGGQGDAHKQVAGIDAINVGGSSANLEGASLRFFTKPAGSGTNAPRLTIDGNGNIQINTQTIIDQSRNITNIASMSVSGTATLGALDIPSNGTNDTRIEIGTSTIANHNAYIDLVGDTTYTDYGLRFIRFNGGANTNSQIVHRGTGALFLEAQDAGSVILKTNGSDALTINSSQNATFAGTLDTSGKLTITNSAYNNHLRIVRSGQGDLNLSPSGNQLLLGGGGFSPASNNAFDLGRTDKYWQDLWLGSTLKMGGTTVLDASRNLTNIGTISSGAITSTGSSSLGSVSVSGNLVVDDTLTIGDDTANSNSFIKFKERITATETNNPFIGQTNSGNGVSQDLGLGANSSSGTVKIYAGNVTAFSESAVRLKVASDHINFTEPLQMGGTQFLSDTRNLTNIGTISSGDVTASRFIQNSNSGSNLYAVEFSRSGTGTTTPDIWGSNNTLVLGTSSSVEAVGFSGANAEFYGTITSSGNLHAGDGTNISMDSSANGQLEVDGNGYQGAIALDGSAMHVYHNSSSRGLVLGTNETARITIGGSGGVNFHSNNLTSVGTINSGAITSSSSLTGTRLNITDSAAPYIVFTEGSNQVHMGLDSGGFWIRQNGLAGGNELLINADGTLSVSHDATFAGSISGTLASTVTATTQAASDNSTKVSTTAYVTTAIANLADSAPSTLNTLNELAAALGDNENFATDVTASIATKLPLAGGTMTGALNMGSNVIQVGGTTVLDSSRQLQNINGIGATTTNTASGSGVGFKFVATDTVVDQTFNGFMIDHNVSGSDTATGDRVHSALLVDQDSSATGGDTSNEHRIYGINASSKATGDSDLIRAGNFLGVADQDSGTVSSVYGINAIGRAQGEAQTTNVYGVYGYAQKQNGGNTTAMYGSFGHALIQSTNTGAVATATGSYGEVQIDSNTTLTTAYGVRSIIDRNDGTIGTGYLIRGNYQGTLPTTAWGVYIDTDVPNYFGGSVQSSSLKIGSTTVIDASRNLTNIGTIGSGAITSTGNVTASNLISGNITVGANAINNSSSRLYLQYYTPANGVDFMNNKVFFNSSGSATFAGSIVSDSSITSNSFMHIVGASGSSGFMYIYDRDNGTSNTDGFLLQKSGNNAFVYNRESSGSLSLGAGDTSNYLVIDSSGNIDLGSTQILDQSRNLTNIGTISSGAITARADTDALFVKSVTNQNAAEIAFSSQGPSTYAQVGRISYQHGDTLAYGGTDVFTIGTTETAPRILADGLLMFKSGLALKPTSGTGAGTTLITSGRALQNITTISSGAITSSSTGTFTSNVTANGVTIGASDVRSSSNILTIGGTSEVVRIHSGNFDLTSGVHKVGGTTVIDASRNLTNIGTISSGAITSSGSLVIGTDDVVSQSDADITIKEGNAFCGIDLKSLRTSGNIGGIRSWNSSNVGVGELLFEVGGRLNYTGSSGFAIGSTTVIDGSRNLTNIGTISSGAITVTGSGTTAATFTNTSGNGGYVNIKSNVGGVATNGSHGLHIGWNKSNGSREINMIFDGGTAQADTEMIFTSTDGTTYTDIFQINGAVGTGVDIKSGGLRIGTTTVIDTSRNLTNINRLTVADGIQDTGQAGSATVFNESGSTADFRVESTSNTHMLFVDGGTNRVGIGTASPGGNLHIKSVGDVGDATLIVEADNDNNNENDNPRIELRQDGNKVAGYLYTEGTGGLSATGTTDNFTVLESIGTSNSQGIQFVTGGVAPGQSSPSDGSVKMTILGNGSVGINDTTPSQKLDINGNLGIGGTEVITSSRNLTNIGTISSGAITSTGSSTFTSTGVMDINLVANPPELNFEDTSSTSGTKRARWTLDDNNFSAQGLSDNDQSLTHNLLTFALSSGAATFGGTISSGRIVANGGGNQHEFTSSSDGPIISKSTDATTGVGFTDNSATNYLFYRGSINHFYFNSGTVGIGVASAGSGQALNVAGGIGISSTTVIDSSRNLLNIGTVSCGKLSPTVTASGQNTALALKTQITGDQGGSMTCDIDFFLHDSNTQNSTPQARIGVTGSATANQNAETGGRLGFYTTDENHGSPTLSKVGQFNPDKSLVCAGDITAFGSPSDIRLKENIENITNPIVKVKKLNGVTFNYKDTGKKSTGLIAQELEKVLPEVVYETESLEDSEDKYKAVRYGNVVGLLVEAIKDQQKEIEYMKSELKTLKENNNGN